MAAPLVYLHEAIVFIAILITKHVWIRYCLGKKRLTPLRRVRRIIFLTLKEIIHLEIQHKYTSSKNLNNHMVLYLRTKYILQYKYKSKSNGEEPTRISTHEKINQ